ncbi:hypothetical protein [Maricaulis sp.]|uniref:hypothetical protein n=1 Tax=Maricaulis sp. TaxID=1486257 RepID=UPI003298F7EA
MSHPLKKAHRGVEPDRAVRDARRLHADIEAMSAAASPARALVEELETRWSDTVGLAPRWSARRTLAFILLSCGSFWFAVAWGLSRLIG